MTSTESSQSLETSAVPQFAVHINFTTPGGEAVPGYLKDSGGKFPVTNGGYTFGWSINNAPNSRDRFVKGVPDELHDSLIHLDKQTPSATWSIDVPNGTYSVHVLDGDPSNFDSVYHMNVNGKSVVSATPNTKNRWFAGTITVVVTNGKLTISDGSGAKNGKIDSIDITSITDPLGVKATPGNGQNTISWNPVPGALYYNVYRGSVTTGEGLAPFASNITATSFTDLHLTNGKAYFYEVTVVTLVGESVVSSEVSGTPSSTLKNTATAAAMIAGPAVSVFSDQFFTSDDAHLHLLGVLDA
jgi:fibronectin type 3 domain-containing protein